MLPPRLHEVARHVLRGQPVADIGTDHARLPVFLVREGIVPSAIAIDNKVGPLAHAQRTITELECPAVALRQGDGLGPLRPGEVDTVVLAGLGGAKIISLLEAWPALATLPRVIMQPNTGWSAVRAWIAAKRMGLQQETMVREGEHTYLTLVIEPSVTVQHPWEKDDDALMLGPTLMTTRPPAWRAWVAAEHARMGRALRRASAAGATDLDMLRVSIARMQRHLASA